MSSERQNASRGADVAARDASVDKTVATILARLGQDHLRRHRERARRHPLKYLTLPYHWLLARRLHRAAIAVANATGGFKDDGRFVKAAYDGVREGRFDDRTALQSLESITRAVAGSESHALTLWRDVAASSPTVVARWMRIRAAQQVGELEEALQEGLRLVAEGRLPPRSLKQLLHEPAMLLDVRNLVQQAAPRPPETVAGKIAYIAASSLPYSTVGYTTRTHGVARGYRSIGYDIHVVTRPPFPLNVRPELAIADVPEYDEIDGIPHHRLLAPSQSQYPPGEYIRHAAAAIEQKLRLLQPEIVIAGSNHTNSLPALVAARRLGLPFIYEVRGMWELSRVSREPEYEASAHFNVSRVLETFVATQADKVLTLTSPMLRDLISRGVAAANICLMPNGVEPELIGKPDRDDALAARMRLPNGVPVIGYVGSIVEYEGLTDLATACASLAARGIRFILMIVGEEKPNASGATPITTEIRRVFAVAGITEWLFMPGRVPFGEVRNYYSLIDIAPIARRPYQVSEMVSPIKPVEALAMGKTLIVSDVEALVDFVQAGRTGLSFRKGDVDDLATTLTKAVQNTALRDQLGHAGMAFVREERTWPRICERAAAHIGIAPAGPA